MELHDFDGLDIDWEGLENAAQRTAHENLMADLRTAVDAEGYGLILTIGFGNYWGQWFSNAAVGYADYLQIMVYDQTGTWSASPFGQHSSYAHAVDAVAYWNGRGVAKSKMILGLPAYGYRFASTAGGMGTAFTYASAVTSDPDLTSADNITADGLGFFNGQDLIIEKTAYAMDEGLAGVFFWEMTQDIQGPRSLHQAAVYQVNGVTLPPLAGFTASTTFVPPSQDVIFTNNSSLGTATSYEWNFGVDANPPTASGIGPHTVTYSSSGFKTISLTVNGPGGENTSTRNNYVNVSVAASVFEAAEAGIKIYPNPVSDIFYVDSERVEVESVEVYNALSTKVIDHKAAGNNKVAIDLSAQAKGVYVLVIKTQGGTYSQRIMKTN